MAKEVKQWITIKGRHIPLFEGETKADAIKRLKAGNKVKGPEPKKATVQKKEVKKEQPKTEKPKSPEEQKKAQSKERVSKALEYAKGKIDKQSYSWKETVLDAEYEHKLNPAETRQLEHLMKAYAIKKGKFTDHHDEWKKKWKEQGFDYDKAVAEKNPKKLYDSRAEHPDTLSATGHGTVKYDAKRMLPKLNPEDSYEKDSKYVEAGERLHDAFKKEQAVTDEWMKAHEALEKERDKYVDEDMLEIMSRREARFLVMDSEHPEIMELKQKSDKLFEKKQALEREMSEAQDYLDWQDKVNSRKQKAAYNPPEFKEAYGEYPGFKRDESTIPYYDERVKDGRAKVVEMSPEEYIKECAYYIFHNSTLEKTLRGRVDADLEDTLKYAQMMRQGVKFNTPYLNYTDEGQEGLHRAVAAYINGIKKMPVIIVGSR